MPKPWNKILLRSIREDDIALTKKSLFHGADINHVDADGNTPLVTAIKTGRVAIMDYLLTKHKPDILKAGPGGKTPIAWAIHRGHFDAVKTLLAYYSNLNTADVFGNTPLIYAIQEGKANIVQHLINNGADVNKVGGSGRTPLLEAIFWGHSPHLVKLLVNKGADVNRLDPDGNTPLASAVARRRTEIAEFLVMLGADVCRRGSMGKPPLCWGILVRDLDMVEFLLENGGGGSVQEGLLEAVRMGDVEMVELMVAKGADPNFVHKNGVTALSEALRLGQDEIF